MSAIALFAVPAPRFGKVLFATIVLRTRATAIAAGVTWANTSTPPLPPVFPATVLFVSSRTPVPGSWSQHRDAAAEQRLVAAEGGVDHAQPLIAQPWK
jgi:hypothetical protein